MRLFVSLTKTEFDALRDLANAEKRRPQDQAAMLLARALSDVTATRRIPMGATTRRADTIEHDAA